MMHRRRLLTTTAVLPLLGTSGCLTTITDKDVMSAAQKASILANGARGVLTSLSSLSIPGLTPSIVGTVGVAIAGIQAVADALAQTSSKADALPLVQKLGAYVSDIVTALSVVAPSLPPSIGIGLTAIQVMLPFIQIAVGMFVPKASPGGMTEAEATAVLVSYGAQVR